MNKLRIAAGSAIAAVTLGLIFLTMRHVFPELGSELEAAELRPTLVTVLAWIILAAAILASLAFVVFAAIDAEALRLVWIVPVFWLGSYAWISLVSPPVEGLYYSWAFDDSYDSVSFSSRSGQSAVSIDGRMYRGVLQLPVKILKPNGLRVVVFLVLMLVGGAWLTLSLD